MIKLTDIITAPFTSVSELLKENYVCVSIVGKVYQEYKGIEEIQRIVNLNTFRMYYHIKVEDWYACNILYRDILERKGIEKLQTEIRNLLTKHNKTKIALCGHGTDDNFCFRHILRDFLNSNGVSTTDVTKINLDVQRAYWKQDAHKAQGHFNLTDEFVGKILEKSTWIFAKTMLKNPHWYTLRKDSDNNEHYLHIVSHIRFYGKPEIFEGVLYRVFYYNGYKYWDHPCDALNEDVDLINRKPTESKQNVTQTRDNGK